MSNADKHPGGRPRKYTPKQMGKLVRDFEIYIDENTIPIIAEFAYTHNIPTAQLYDFPEFSKLLKKSIDKKQTNLEKGALSNKLNVTMSIFSLKQLGWSDKVESKINVISDEETSEKLDERIEQLLAKRKSEK